MTVTKESFDALLDWLNPDREIAGQKYELIRAGLIRIFVSKGFSDAEDYVDEAIDRVIKRLPDIRADYSGDPARYFHGVARHIILEALRSKEVLTDSFPDLVSEEVRTTDLRDCLDQCLKVLPGDKRTLILDYHLYQGRAKVEHHRTMAGELSISEGALRTRAHHLRLTLETCVLKCLEERGEKQKPGQKP